MKQFLSVVELWENLLYCRTYPTNAMVHGRFCLLEIIISDELLRFVHENSEVVLNSYLESWYCRESAFSFCRNR